MGQISCLRMTVFTLVILMCVSPSWTKEPHCFLRSFHALSNDQGPTFSNYGNSYADGFNPETIITFTVTVEDSNGVETVIASYRNQTEDQWSNITMQDLDANSTGSRYEAYLHVKVSDPGVYVWDIQFVANDTLGYSSVSEVIQHSYRWNWPDPVPSSVIILAIGGVGALLLVIGVVMKRGVVRPKS